jgi:competence protein ComEA
VTKFLTKKELLALFSVAAALVIGGGFYYLGQRSNADEPQPAPILELPAPETVVEVPHPEILPPEEEPQPAPPPEDVTVAVVGAVVNPGLYTLEPDQRVLDLIEAAGGLNEYADTSDINAAARLIDGTTLTVPMGWIVERSGNALSVRPNRSGPVWNPPQYTLSGWTEAAPEESFGTTEGRSDPSNPVVNINTAGQTELETLPGIGPATAVKIIDLRKQQPFQRVDDLMNVHGIGPKKLEILRPWVTVGGQ